MKRTDTVDALIFGVFVCPKRGKLYEFNAVGLNEQGQAKLAWPCFCDRSLRARSLSSPSFSSTTRFADAACTGRRAESTHSPASRGRRCLIGLFFLIRERKHTEGVLVV